MKIKYLIYIGVILIILASAFYLYSSSATTNKPLDKNTELEWETYKNDLYEFSFKHPKDSHLAFGNDQDEYLLTVQNTDPNERLDSNGGIEYWAEFSIHSSENKEESKHCSELIENGVESNLDGYKIYKSNNSADPETGVIDEKICFERPNYNLLVHGIDFNHYGYNILNNLISSIKFF